MAESSETAEPQRSPKAARFGFFLFPSNAPPADGGQRASSCGIRRSEHFLRD
jgi:hypothetical protein